MEPLVSVVVPVFNGLPHLPALIESLLSQTYPNLEIVFTEGGGTDGSLDYLRGLSDPRIRVVQMPPGTSAAENWTAATLEARGEFTKLICQDDLLYPEAIALQVADLQQNPSAAMAIAQRDIVDATGRRLYANRGLAGLSEGLLPGNATIKECYLRGTNVIGEPLAVLFRTEALKGALPWQDENPLMLDLAMYTKVSPQGDIVARKGSIGAFRVSSGSWSTQLAKQQLSQTKAWQDAYDTQLGESITTADRWRAATGRRVQVNLRRLAYAYLRARGTLGKAPPKAASQERGPN